MIASGISPDKKIQNPAALSKQNPAALSKQWMDNQHGA
jgi:hypothetical protein